ncbi:MAG: Arm DNA-binding domain-containing protein [Azonexus sp.]|nr:Arm DNA-binding domain-containing protein [Azonexus sp.]
MPLTDTAVRTAKPGDKPIKMFDERGLFLIVTPAGGKWWRLRYKFDGKEKLLSLGTYPDVSLKDATGRAERDPCPDLRGALPPLRHDNFASITEPAKVAELLRAMDAFSGTFVVGTTPCPAANFQAYFLAPPAPT